jgi:nucleoside phosphorylase
LSGEKLIDDVEYNQFPQAIGGEMEGYGVAAAADRAKVEWILAKAICDWGDGEKHKKHQPLAAGAAVSLVLFCRMAA